MNYANFQKISPKETWEKWARVSFFCIFVTSYNFETTTRACVSEARLRHPLVWNSDNTVNCFELLCPTWKLFLEILGHMFGDKIQKKENLPYGWLTHWKWATMVAKIRPLRVTRGGWCCAWLTRRFFKACAIARFRNQFARGHKTIGSHLNCCLLWSKFVGLLKIICPVFFWFWHLMVGMVVFMIQSNLDYPYFSIILTFFLVPIWS